MSAGCGSTVATVERRSARRRAGRAASARARRRGRCPMWAGRGNRAARATSTCRSRSARRSPPTARSGSRGRPRRARATVSPRTVKRRQTWSQTRSDGLRAAPCITSSGSAATGGPRDQRARSPPPRSGSASRSPDRRPRHLEQRRRLQRRHRVEPGHGERPCSDGGARRPPPCRRRAAQRSRPASPEQRPRAEPGAPHDRVGGAPRAGAGSHHEQLRAPSATIANSKPSTASGAYAQRSAL